MTDARSPGGRGKQDKTRIKLAWIPSSSTFTKMCLLILSEGETLDNLEVSNHPYYSI